MAAVSHSSHIQPIDRPDSRVSLARSDTTYHSFQDVDLPEPKVPDQPAEKASIEQPAKVPKTCPPPPSCTSIPEEGSSIKKERPHVWEMRRQDSGYESLSPRDSCSSHRKSTSATTSPSTTRQRRSTKSPRSSRSGTATKRPRSGRHSPPQSRHQTSQQQPQQQQQESMTYTYFHFPSFTPTDPSSFDDDESPSSAAENTVIYPILQQTTYWTSDRTRRLEYAAIDAASKGLRGWIMRHVVPECFVPRGKRYGSFGDDTGSVVRYRIEPVGGDEDGEREQEGDEKRAEQGEGPEKKRGWRWKWLFRLAFRRR